MQGRMHSLAHSMLCQSWRGECCRLSRCLYRGESLSGVTANLQHNLLCDVALSWITFTALLCMGRQSD